MVVLLRKQLKYALTYREVVAIVMQRLISVDRKVRTDKCYPAGSMDVVSIAKIFWLLWLAREGSLCTPSSLKSLKYKLCKVRAACFGEKGIPYITTFDRRTIRYPDPLIKANDTIKIEIETRKAVEFIKFNIGNIAMVTVVATEAGLGLSTTVESIREVLKLCTHKMLPIKSLPPIMAMCLLLVDARDGDQMQLPLLPKMMPAMLILRPRQVVSDRLGNVSFIHRESEPGRPAPNSTGTCNVVLEEVATLRHHSVRPSPPSAPETL
ncbi:hypothetical protein GOP47_0006236 [Adiantum capillus-veneris]|uniref:Small ribosomal subunit protein eS4 central region domain-containing protein n=1 Tax=Adiantum capillus-veneris TaxID=13818 RepID=A0A9D4ZMU8_ADICA|nr:hypothetical protein GOP47_0006236 [Adiantum capillus-veneris]